MTLKCAMIIEKIKGRMGNMDKMPLSLNISFLLTQASVQALRNKFILIYFC